MTVKKRYILQIESVVKGEQGIQGPAGPAAELALPINDTDVIHQGTQSTGLTVSAILDSLLFIDLVISTFKSNSSLKYELGTILNSISLQWTYNKIITSQSLSSTYGNAASILSTLRVYTLSLVGANANFSVTLTADDGSGNPPLTAVVSFQFIRSIYYGKSIIPASVNSAFLLTLNSLLSTTRVYEFIEDLGVNEYIWFAVPSSYMNGTEQFKINGFGSSLIFVGVISHTNSSGTIENYNVYRTEFSNLGITTLKIT